MPTETKSYAIAIEIINTTISLLKMPTIANAQTGQVGQIVGASPHTSKGHGFYSWMGFVWEATNQYFSLISMFLSFSLSPLSPSLSQINKHVIR